MENKTLSEEIEELEAFVECQTIYMEMCSKRIECATKYINFLRSLLKHNNNNTVLDGYTVKKTYVGVLDANQLRDLGIYVHNEIMEDDGECKPPKTL